MRVLHIGLSHNPGGVETFAIGYYRRLVQKAIQFDFINMYDHIAHEEEILSLGGQVYKVPNVKKHPLAYKKEVSKIILEGGYEVVHIHALSAANVVPFKVAHKLGVRKIISHAHNPQIPGFHRQLLHKMNQHRLLNYATDYWTCSKEAALTLYGNKINQEQVVMIPNAIHVDSYAYNTEYRNRIRKELSIADDAVVIGHVGRMDYIKNHDFLLDVFQQIHLQQENSVLIMVGDGSLRDNIEYKCNHLGLNDSVRILGLRTDIPELMSGMDMLMLPSFSEGWPLVTMEAQSSGLPILASTGVPKESKMIDNFSFMDLQEGASAWAKECIRLAELGRDLVGADAVKKSGYDLDSNAEHLIELYKE